jgi:uncharacterized surface protein with fasciclin (FAS1) repeats
MKKASFAIVAALAGTSLVACGDGSDDYVSTPPDGMRADAMEDEGEEQPTIAEIAAGAEDFSILVDLLTATGLVDTFAGNRQFTVFAPTNDAFEALFEVVDPATLTEEQIVGILLYHVSPGERFSGDVLESDRIRMLSKEFAWVDAEALTINDANLILELVDIDASNGVIHAIDAVLLPPSL